MKKNRNKSLVSILIAILIIIAFKNNYIVENILNKYLNPVDHSSYSLDNIPQYTDKLYVTLNNNEPSFENKDKITKSFERYSSLDKLGRAGVAYANISIDTMPNKKRGSIGNIKPSGWHTIKYDNIDGSYLYNRCHLIGYQLTGENDNKKNLITCTRSMNTIGMLEFENRVSTYIKETQNHVLYRVTPIYNENNLLASGIQIEAYSLEDNGEGIKFNVYVYNVQEGIEINYKTGESNLKK